MAHVKYACMATNKRPDGEHKCAHLQRLWQSMCQGFHRSVRIALRAHENDCRICCVRRSDIALLENNFLGFQNLPSNLKLFYTPQRIQCLQGGVCPGFRELDTNDLLCR